MITRLGIFSTHPVQYHVPVWRRLAQTPGLEVKVFYFNDHSVTGGLDPGFGVPVTWDVPLLEGYEYQFIARNADLSKPYAMRIPDPINLLNKEKFDWILIQGYTHGFERQLIRLARRMHYKIVIRGEFTDMPRYKNKLKRGLRNLYLEWFYSYVHSFCYIGMDAYEHLRRRGICQDKLFFSPYAVDNQLLESQIHKFDRLECRRRLGLCDNHFAFLFSGKFIPRKMPLLLAEAVEDVYEREQVVLIMLGDGTLREQVSKRLSSLLGPRLIMPGFVNQSELGRYFSAADAFILPSNYETWGLVVNEAMQFGLPAIVSDKVGCRRDLIIPGETGFIFSSGNAQDLSMAIKFFLGNPETVMEMGIKARKHVAGYTVENATKGILTALNL